MKGGTYLKKTFSISYILYSRNSVLTHNYQSVHAECENTLGVNLRAKPAVFSREKISVSLQLLFKEVRCQQLADFNFLFISC